MESGPSENLSVSLRSQNGDVIADEYVISSKVVTNKAAEHIQYGGRADCRFCYIAVALLSIHVPGAQNHGSSR